MVWCGVGKKRAADIAWSCRCGGEVAVFAWRRGVRLVAGGKRGYAVLKAGCLSREQTTVCLCG